MKKINTQTLILFAVLTLLTGCARDLSDDVYTSDSTLSLTLQGEIITSRPVTIKESDKKSDNVLGGAIGAGSGAVLGSLVGKGAGNTLATLGGALGGGTIGVLAQDKLSQSRGIEYIIKLDITNLNTDQYASTPAMRNAASAATTGGAITVVQGAGRMIPEGQRVFVIFSGNRARVIPANRDL